mmetsp:Transcript_17755/g.46341  ORF Transcript_17755/g.46341 Transcript_17755/m.46341 type:complete len:90 (+) Transcript_17755:59-328(+)
MGRLQEPPLAVQMTQRATRLAEDVWCVGGALSSERRLHTDRAEPKAQTGQQSHKVLVLWLMVQGPVDALPRWSTGRTCSAGDGGNAGVG